MNWQAMGLMAAALSVASVLAAVAVWLQDSGMDPLWIIGGLFLLAILAVGRLCR